MAVCSDQSPAPRPAVACVTWFYHSVYNLQAGCVFGGLKHRYTHPFKYHLRNRFQGKSQTVGL